jgi:hypothetical protein
MYENQNRNITDSKRNEQLGIILPCGHLKYKTILQKYKKIFGFTGTLEKLDYVMRNQIKSYFSEWSYCPSMFGKSITGDINQGCLHIKENLEGWHNIINKLRIDKMRGQ